MKKRIITRALTFASPALVLLAAGCADLKGVNRFVVSGSKTIAQPFPYAYGEYCFDSCYIFDASGGVGNYPCDCSVPVTYDTAVTREAGKLSNYFLALAKLSGSAEVINVDTLAGAVTAGKYGRWTISSTDAQVASGVATGIQDLLTANFKSKKITANLHQFGNAVDSSLDAYITHLTNLDSLTRFLLIYLETQLVGYRATAAPGPERWAVLYAYNEKIKDLTGRHAQFSNLIRQVQLIRDGYHQLTLNADAVKSKPLKQHLLALVNNITYLSNSKK